MRIEWKLRGVSTRYRGLVLIAGNHYDIDEDDLFFKRALIRGHAIKIEEINSTEEV